MKYFILICIAYIACGIGYHIGKYEANKQHTKDYQVASIMTTCCNNMIDNLGVDAEEIFYEYIDNLYCYPGITITKEDIDSYNLWH